MNKGWIKLHRKFTEWEWYDQPNMIAVFIHCLFKANYKDKKWRGKMIKRGQFVTGISKFGDEVGLSFQQVRTAWDKLEKTGEITTKSTNKGTTVTVCNYNTYQDSDLEDNKQDNNRITNEQQTNNKQITTTKKDNNKKNIKKITIGDDLKYTGSERIDFISFIDKFNEMYGRTGRAKLRMLEDRREQIRARLRTFSAKEILIAWENRKTDPYLNGEGSKYMDDWEAAMRNDKKIERYLTKTDDTGNTGQKFNTY